MRASAIRSAWRSSGRARSISSCPKAASLEALPLYQWKILQFESPRPFAIRELVKLAVAGVDRRIYSAVRLLEDGTLAITGLAREGLNADRDPFVKIIASRPGCLTIRSGRDLAARVRARHDPHRWRRCRVLRRTVRRALETIAGTAGLEGTALANYLDAVRSLVREMAAHGRGGILIVSPEEHPPSRGGGDLSNRARLVGGLSSARSPAHQPEEKPRSAVGAKSSAQRIIRDRFQRGRESRFRSPVSKFVADGSRASRRRAQRADWNRRRDHSQPRSGVGGIRGDSAGWTHGHHRGGGG